MELHAFGDASHKAYAAVIYAKVGQQVTLLLAKSKVNPIKNRKTIPKLELCSAHLLATILKRVKRTLNLQCKIYAWSDSMVTLAWIQNKNNKEKFIRTRVNDINEMIPEAEWRYVKSSENPADVASRGTSPEKLLQHKLWLQGPTWLQLNADDWPNGVEEKIVTTTTITEERRFSSIIQKFSDLGKLIRVMAYVIRFTNKLKKKR